MLSKWVGDTRIEIAQDGTKRRLLCGDCEQRIGSSERLFREHFFLPGQTGVLHRVSYGPWLSQFVTSIAWRLSVHYLEDGGFDDLPAQVRATARVAANKWREHLLDQTTTVEPYSCHLYQFTTDALDTSFGRYITNAIDYFPAWEDGPDGPRGLILAKLGRIAIIGRYSNSEPHLWRGTRVQENRGVFEADRGRLPVSLWQAFRKQAQETASMRLPPGAN